MADIRRDDEVVELSLPPRYEYGERVVSRNQIRNDGTFPGREVGDLLVSRGEIGYVRSIGTFLQQYYIYEVEFIASGHRVGMRGKELMSLDDLPEDVLAGFSEQQRAQLRGIGRGGLESLT